MIIDCIADLHGFRPETQGGDLLIVAGDLTGRNTLYEYEAFVNWLNLQDYKKKIVIAGNHDGLLEKEGRQLLKWAANTEYLLDSATEFEGLKIWGSPWTPTFCNWHFMLDRFGQIKKKWDLIPDGIDILVTHGPPYGVLDECQYSKRSDKFKHAGCEELRYALERLMPKLHVFGHIHEQGGRELLFKHEGPNTLCINASIMNEHYEPKNPVMRVIL